MSWLYNIIKFFLWLPFLLFTHRRVMGKENIPSQGGLLVVANHINMFDVPLLVASLTRGLIFMTKKELFQPPFSFLGYLIGKFGNFPVHRERFDRKALSQAEEILTNNLALVIFPEGTRSRNGRLQRAFPGPALIAFHSGALILPVGITGTEKIKGVGWIVTRPRITVNIGAPFHLPSISGKLTRTELTEYTETIMKHIAILLPTEYQGYYELQRD
jgi:1-acyl-sn-glycerol-3-phosphate acyltransferase